MKSETKGRIVSALVSGNSLLLSKLGDWYRKNPYHKFNEGDILILKARNIVGYGIRPIAVVKGYEVKDFGFGDEGRYSITMHVDNNCNFDDWMRKNEVLQGVERTIKENECHFKWNIENQFEKVSVSGVDEALEFYRSKEKEQITA